jgi:hypothetical protein
MEPYDWQNVTHFYSSPTRARLKVGVVNVWTDVIYSSCVLHKFLFNKHYITQFLKEASPTLERRVISACFWTQFSWETTVWHLKLFGT